MSEEELIITAEPIQSIKATLKKENEEETYTKKEIEELIETMIEEKIDDQNGE